MRQIANKLVYDSLAEMAEPSRAALLVVDMQNDFCSSEGVFGRNGAEVGRIQAIVPGLRLLMASAREAGVRTMFLRHTHEPDLSNISPARLSFYAALYEGKTTPYHAIRDTWGHEIIPELEPLPDEAVINKGRSSGFIGTNLDMMLRSNRIETVIVTGMATHACVESTARDAGFLDYYVVVVSDCVADYREDLHQASLLTLSQRVVLARSHELREVWRKTVRGAA